MGLLDKVKSQAASATAAAKDAAQVAKDAAQKGQAKLDAVQSKRAADAMLRDLGAVVYGQRTGRAAPDADGDAARLVASLREFESEHGQIDLGSHAAGTSGTAAADGTGSEGTAR